MWAVKSKKRRGSVQGSERRLSECPTYSRSLKEPVYRCVTLEVLIVERVGRMSEYIEKYFIRECTPRWNDAVGFRGSNCDRSGLIFTSYQTCHGRYYGSNSPWMADFFGEGFVCLDLEFLVALCILDDRVL